MITRHKIVSIEKRRKLARVDVLDRGTKNERQVETHQDIGWAITLEGQLTIIVPERPPFEVGDVIYWTWSKEPPHVTMD